MNINMAKTEHLMSNLKSGGETYLRKIYTQEHSFKKIFLWVAKDRLTKYKKKNGY